MSKELIAAAGVVIGALLAAAVNWYSARLKARELAMSYEQRLRDDYLANARTYTRSLYVPLHQALSSLEDAYERFRPFINDKRSAAPDDLKRAFNGACETFVAHVGQLLASGDAFITTQLEAGLRRFTAFIAASLDATEPRQKIVLRYGIGLPFAGVSMSWERAAVTTRTWRGRAFPALSMRLVGTSVAVSSEEVLAAPMTSEAFEERVASDIPTLKGAIKEVTLGGHISSRNDHP